MMNHETPNPPLFFLDHFVRDPARAKQAKAMEAENSVVEIIRRAEADFDDVDKEELVAAYDLLVAHDISCDVLDASTKKRALLEILKRDLNREYDSADPYPRNWVDQHPD